MAVALAELLTAELEAVEMKMLELSTMVAKLSRTRRWL